MPPHIYLQITFAVSHSLPALKLHLQHYNVAWWSLCMEVHYVHDIYTKLCTSLGNAVHVCVRSASLTTLMYCLWSAGNHSKCYSGIVASEQRHVMAGGS